MKVIRRTLLSALVLPSVLLATAFAENTAIIPAPRDANWLKRHDGFVEQAKRGGVNLLFLGDSITDGWRSKGKAIWEKYYAPRQAANFGIGGDRTQHVLWRLQNGELDGIQPKVVVLLIGVNNAPIEKDGQERNTAPEIVEGVGAVVKELQARLPKTKILLLGVLPYKQKGEPMRLKVEQINKGIAKLDRKKNVTYRNINQNFLAPDGTLSTEIMPDLLHPNEAGYQIWADAIEPTLAKLLK